MDLDQMLDAAAPPITARTPELHRELRTMVAASEPPRRRRAARLALAGGIVAGVVGLGAGAAAAGILPGWTMLTTASGQTCEVEVRADPRIEGDGEPITAAFSRVERDATLSAARAFLLGLNPSTARGRYAAARQALKEALTELQPSSPVSNCAPRRG